LKKINFRTSYHNFKFQEASDACLNISDHIKTCRIRISKLIKRYKNSNSYKEKKILNFLNNEIIPSFKKINKEINNNFNKKQIKKKLNRNDMILSPSDFGFHNIIKSKDNLFFIDFEYAGWDDPIKLICDFFLNPDYLISKANKKYFLSNFFHIFRGKILNYGKFRLIYKFHFLKWVCVILSQVDIEIHKKSVNLSYINKALNYFNKNKGILK